MEEARLEAGGAATEPPPNAPVPGAARLPALDALRGLALLGVVAVNAPILLGPEARLFAMPWRESTSPAALAAIHLLFAGKAYALLAFLFGAGLALQDRRLGARSAAVLPRRLGALAAIGAAHGLLLWYGDILAVYATVGLAWWVFLRDASERVRARWGLGLLAALPAMMLASGAALWLVGALAPAAVAPMREAALRHVGEDVARSVEVYRSGSVAEIFAFRARAFLATYASTLAFLPQLLGLVLAGGWAVGRGLLDHPAEHRPLLARVAVIGVLAGGAGELGYAALTSGGLGPVGVPLLAQGLHAASAPALALGAAAALLLRWSRGGAGWLLPFARLGRVSLSAYLAQSVVFTTIAYAYGGGLYGSVGLDTCLALALACWAIQAALAALYLSRFEIGPAEWAWRRLTYRA